MIIADLPPIEVVEPAPSLSQEQSLEFEETLAQIKKRLPNTKILDAWPSKVPGLITLKLDSGRVAYTDESARFLIMGVIFDLDTGQGLDGQMDSTD